MAAQKSPFDVLLSYQQRALEIRGDMPPVHDQREEWTGLAFRLGTDVLIAPMIEVEEIIDLPECAPVPDTKPWFLGIGNVRGNLVPVTDLHSFVFGEHVSNQPSARVLTCGDGESTVGLLVDEVLGLRRFYLDEQHEQTSRLPEQLTPFATSAFKRDADIYPVFQVKQFANSNELLNITR